MLGTKKKSTRNESGSYISRASHLDSKPCTSEIPHGVMRRWFDLGLGQEPTSVRQAVEYIGNGRTKDSSRARYLHMIPTRESPAL